MSMRTVPRQRKIIKMNYTERVFRDKVLKKNTKLFYKKIVKKKKINSAVPSKEIPQIIINPQR